MEKVAWGERIYEQLKARALSGQHLPGERLHAPALAEEFSSSLTPVRAALFRLVGDRLIDWRPNTGFHIPNITEHALRNLYAWNEMILVQAIAMRRIDVQAAVKHAALDPSTPDVVALTAQTFSAVARLPDNEEFTVAIRNANDRLHPIRVRKDGLLDLRKEELLTLTEALLGAGFSQLEQMLRVYHRRRMDLVPELVRRLHEATRPFQ